MPRKRPNLSKNSREAKRKRLARSQESNDERQVRLEAARERQAMARSLESPSDRDARLSYDRERQSSSRASETLTERNLRLTADSEGHALSRASETFTERSLRLTADSERHATSRASETSPERDSRLTADRERHTLSRASETFTQRSLWLTADSERHATSRASETSPERDSRLRADRERHTLSRASETFTERSLRLTADSERHATSRASETFTERSLRLTADSERHAMSRASETSPERDSRLTTDRERHALSRASETLSQYEERLRNDRDRHNRARSLESDDQHQQRLEEARENYERLRRNNEIFLENERLRVGMTRSEETEEQLQARLDADRLRYSLNRISISSEDSDEAQQVGHNTLPWINKERSAFNYTPMVNYSECSSIGGMIIICPFCDALKWQKEANGMCCSGGKVRIDLFENPPEVLKSLLNGDHPQSKHFLDNVRAYNNAFQMTSFGAKQISEGPFMPTFKIQGQVYHLIGSLLPENQPQFLQIYFVSNYEEQANIRNQIYPQLNGNLITVLQSMLHQVNPYVHSFKAALESVPQGQNNNYKFVINAEKRPAAEHRGRHNTPVANEVAAVLVDQECERRDIVLRTRDDRLQRIYETHRSYDALQYPLIYSRGEDGYNFGIHQVNPTTREPNLNKKVSAQQFYAAILQIRRDRFAYLQRFRGLFSQFIVDMYAKIETERLVYIRTNQRRLRAEEYVHLRDAMQQDADSENLGRLVILPSSFTGGPRYMHERTQDAFCYVRKYGRPDLFITFTTNPKWNEITQELFAGQASYDRHDVVARVFHLKLKIMIDLLTKESVFGPFLCFMYSVEWQKRGLPHAHILLWLQNKIRPNDVDTLISAELPNPEEDPALYEIIKTHMVHGPCGILNRNSPCMKDGHCTKRYPRALVEQTVTGENGYPSYRRRSPQQGGYTAEIRLRGQQLIIDNSWVVPYSPLLSKIFGAHINVEMCNSVEAIKYICKYVNKGNDQATFALQGTDRDEVTRYQTGRYISTSEAIWRILGFGIHERHPTVMHLDVHLENGQRIYFDADNARNRVENPRQTTLLAFFRLCKEDDFAKTLTYDEVPSYYTFDKQRGVFNRRRRGQPVEGFPGVFKDSALGRVYTVHPSSGECFYLRLLLHNVQGPTSFQFLKTVHDVEHPTFQSACRALQLLEGDQHWDATLEEACVSDSPKRLRHLFAVMLVFCGISDPLSLWEKYKTYFSEDFHHSLRRNLNQDTDPNDERVINSSLCSIQEILLSIGGKSLSDFSLPSPQILPDQPRINREYASEINYSSTDLTAIVNDNLQNFTPEQREIFDIVVQSVLNNEGKIFFLDAPGGTGKTYLTKAILAEFRRQGKIALAVASSGIAATLLPGGKTAHTMFKIPIDLDSTETPTCAVTRNCDKAKVFQDCCLIVWDECTMANKKAVEAVDRTLRDIRRNDIPMGNVTVLFSGDFRQTLPVVTRGTRADEINASLKRSYLWPQIIRMRLTINMRAQLGGNSQAQTFSNILLEIGEGTLPEDEGQVVIPDILGRVVSSEDELINSVFGDVSSIIQHDNSWLCERAILTPKNEQAAALNAKILAEIGGDEVVYTSYNSVVHEDDATNYPIEFLSSLTASGLPAHKITLKVGVPIMLLRNLTPPKLCNGTRLKVSALQRNLIHAEILTGCGAGETVFIPRIPLIPNNFPFEFKRTQFPISLCFAMTINKSQGQTLKAAGVDLRSNCFSHGQLYVACSRVSSAEQLFVLAPTGKTTNVVYRDIL